MQTLVLSRMLRFLAWPRSTRSTDGIASRLRPAIKPKSTDLICDADWPERRPNQAPAERTARPELERSSYSLAINPIYHERARAASETADIHQDAVQFCFSRFPRLKV